jgi:AraC-like DNA-binding protein
VRQLNEFNNLLNATPFNGVPYKLFFSMVFLSVTIYTVLAFRQLLQRKNYKKSSHHKTVYNWIRSVAWIMVLMAVLMLINVIVTSFKVGTAAYQIVYFGPFYELRLILFTVVLYKIVFSSGLRLGLPNFAKNIHEIQNQVGGADASINEIELSYGVLSSEQVNSYQTVLDHFFIHESETFTELEFNLEHLSQATQIPKHHWAYFFRYYSTVSFVDLRNRYRIEHAKKIMQFPAYRHYTIEAIGEASGFGSRTTFFNAFKKFENISPSEYFDKIKR